MTRGLDPTILLLGNDSKVSPEVRQIPCRVLNKPIPLVDRFVCSSRRCALVIEKFEVDIDTSVELLLTPA